MKPEKCAENVYLSYVRKKNLLKIWWLFLYSVVMIFFFFREMYGDKVNNTSLHVLYFDDEAFFTCRQSLARTIQHIFFQLAPKLLWNCFSWRNYGYKINVMIWQRISRSGKSRQKWDFLPWLYCNAVSFQWEAVSKMRLLYITQFHWLLCSWLQAMVRESPQETKCSTFVLQFFLGYFFTIANSQNIFFSLELQQIRINSTCKWMKCVLCE